MLTENIITGEKFQYKCKLYIGETNENFSVNPTLGLTEKNKLLKDINNNFDNPDIIFCYSHLLLKFVEKIKYFNNPFILISGNSDGNIIENSEHLEIANNNKIISWYAQNLSFNHNKVKPLPIGIANSQWKHGNIPELINIINNIPQKTNFIYFNFNIYTNFEKRMHCYNMLSQCIEFLPDINAVDHFHRLSTHKFCICPEGNGLDSHRIWECYYLKVVPIVLNNQFIQILKKEYNIPMIILNNWDEIKNINFHYESYNFDYEPILNLINNIHSKY